MHDGRELVSATFVIPYPPGFPVLVPGQVVSEEIIQFLLALDVTEIHGYRPELGLKIFTEKVLHGRGAAASNGKSQKKLEPAIAAKKEPAKKGK
jgi:arginine decarboxylase